MAGVTTLYHRERDIALAAYDGDAAASAIVDHARFIHGANATKIAELLSSDAQVLYKHGRDCGSNVHLVAAIALRHEQLALGASGDERAAAQQLLIGVALATLGQRENGTEKLEAAVEAFRSALAEWTPEQVPLDWARAQNNVGLVLARLGERDSGTVRLEEAVAAYRAALEELTRRRVPLDWAQTQNNLGFALKMLGERESGTARLEESVAAYRAALEERTHERVPLGWAGTQYNLGNALSRLSRGEQHGASRERGSGLSRGPTRAHARSGPARLGEDAGTAAGECALQSRRAGGLDCAVRGRDRRLSGGAKGNHTQARTARMGGDADKSWCRTHVASCAGARDRATPSPHYARQVGECGLNG